MNEQKPIIDPHTNDNYINNSNKNIKIAIVLTIVLFAVLGFIGYSISNKVGTVGHLGDDSKTTTKATSAVTLKSDVETLEELEIDNYLYLKLKNVSKNTLDVIININTYAGKDIVDTYTTDITAVSALSEAEIVIDKKNLGVYDRYEIKYTTRTSIYKSLISNNLLLEEDSALVDNKLFYNIVNKTGKNVDKLTVIVLFMNNNEIVDVKTKSIFGVGESDNITIDDSTKEYSTVNAFISEAYTI